MNIKLRFMNIKLRFHETSGKEQLILDSRRQFI